MQITTKRKKKLVTDAQYRKVTLEGSPCTVTGWRSEYATLAPHFGGFWNASWETVNRVLSDDGNFTADDVTFASWRWLGYGDEIPDRLKAYAT